MSQKYTKEKEIINSEIQKLLDGRVIAQGDREANDFFSTVFTRKKKDGSSRTILNLKYLNEFVRYRHFKMAPPTDVFKTIKKDVWIASVDLKDTFFTVPVNVSHQKIFQGWVVSKLLQILGYAKWLLRCNADFYKNPKACFWTFTESSFQDLRDQV